MKKSAVIIILVIVLAVGAGAFAVMNKSDKTPDTATTQTTPADTTAPETPVTQPSLKDQQAADVANTDATITYTDSGFSPSKITVKSGSKVTIKNETSRALQFNSDPHPVHNGNQELNVDLVPSGQTKTFTVTKKGSFGYHDHLDPSKVGTIVVE